MGRRRAWLRAALVLALVVACDQVTKHLISASIAPGSARRLFAGLRLVHDDNSGIAFSLGSGSHTVVVVLIAIGVAAIVLYFAANAGRRLLWLPAGLVGGGAVGNLIDRIRLGAVTDFIKLPHWPAFNVADISITVGVLVLLLLVGGEGRRTPEA